MRALVILPTYNEADNVLATHLRVKPGQALLQLQRRSSSAGRPIDHLTVLYRPDRFQYEMSLTLGDGQ